MLVEDRLFRPRYKDRKGIWRESDNWAIRLTVGCKRTVRSLKTPNKAEAVARAKRIMKAVDSDKWKLKAIEPKAPPEHRIKPFLEDYKEKRQDLSDRTVQENLRVVRWFARKLNVSTLESLDEALFRKADMLFGSMKPVTRNTKLRILASVTGQKYSDLFLPDARKPFLPLSVDHKSLVQKAMDELSTPKANMVLLALCAGLRSGEMAGVRKEHLSKHGIMVFGSKGGKWRQVPLDRPFITVLKGRFDKSGKLVYGYKDRLNREVAKWLRVQGIVDPKPLHYLRKYYGSQLATHFGLYVAKEYLGHSTVQVTESYYAALLDKPVLKWG